MDMQLNELISESVLVTGASSGIGLAVIRTFAKLGYQVIAVVRKSSDVGRIERIILDDNPASRINVQLADLTQANDIEQLVKAVESLVADKGLHCLVNCAGLPASGPLSTFDFSSLEECIRCNTIAPVVLAVGLLPCLERARGRVINVGSIAGVVSMPFNGVYAGSKAAIRSLSEAMSGEFSLYSVRVCHLNLGAVATPIWGKCIDATHACAQDKPLYAESLDRFNGLLRQSSDNGIPPHRVAQKIADIATKKRPRTHYTIGLDALTMTIMDCFVPALVQHQVMKHLVVLKKEHFSLSKHTLLDPLAKSIRKIWGTIRTTWAKHKVLVAISFGMGCSIVIMSLFHLIPRI